MDRRGTAKGQPRDSQGTAKGQPRDSQGTAKGSHGTAMGQPWDSHGTAMGQPWDSHGTAMPTVSVLSTREAMRSALGVGDSSPSPIKGKQTMSSNKPMRSQRPQTMDTQ
jgi:hypothetical protein